MGFGESKTPEHLARHPFGRIPVVDHGDFRLYETQAILRYLDDLYPTPPFQPKDARAKARMNQLVGITRLVFLSQGDRHDYLPALRRPDARRHAR